MNRTPPSDVRRVLRQEVGYGCPIPGCGSPYLEWHHFDPPWAVRPHHNPTGMIALCSLHHPQADGGAFSPAQLREYKTSAASRVDVQGVFNWRRNRLVTVVGGSFYYEVPIILQYKGDPVISFIRDEAGYFLLNLRMLTTSREPRVTIEENGWVARGDPTDFECPPSGRLIKARYGNGDALRIYFQELRDPQEAQQRYPNANFDRWSLEYPTTALEITMAVGETAFRLGPDESSFPGGFVIRGALMKDVNVGIDLG